MSGGELEWFLPRWTERVQSTGRSFVLTEQMSRRVRSREFCGTLNNWTDPELETLLSLPDVFALAGEEHAPTTGTPHLQFWLVFKNARVLSSVKAGLPRAHVEACRGNRKQNYDYCTKEGVFHSRGVCPNLTPNAGAGDAGVFYFVLLCS